jgi:hypothetical protein
VLVAVVAVALAADEEASEEDEATVVVAAGCEEVELASAMLERASEDAVEVMVAALAPITAKRARGRREEGESISSDAEVGVKNDWGEVRLKSETATTTGEGKGGEMGIERGKGNKRRGPGVAKWEERGEGAGFE